jgi:Phosphoribosylanthranilate isomerase
MSIRVKICGIARIEDGALALRLGADELGFVLAPSPRRVEAEAVKAILGALRGDGSLPPFRAVGVFVNEAPDAMRDIMSYAGLDIAQIHGNESPAACAAFDFPWYRALRASGATQAEALFARDWACSRLLIDTPRGDASGRACGGTGGSVGAWTALAAKAAARERGREFFLAGRIGPESVASAVHSICPDGLDLSSGVESSPGRKSPERLEAFFRNLKIAESEREEALAYAAETR